MCCDSVRVRTSASPVSRGVRLGISEVDGSLGAHTDFEWVDGSSRNYTAWADGEPLLPSSCGYVAIESGAWNR